MSSFKGAKRARFANRLLLALSKSDHALLAPALAPIELRRGQPIEQANTAIEHVYFPESGIVSVVAKSGGDQIEAGVVGWEGVTGTAIVMGNHRSPNDAFVQVAGHGHRVTAKRLRAVLNASPTLRRLLQRYAHVFMMQIAQTALANGKANIEVRLARWLLMAQDRHEGDDLHLTHDFIAVMLGVRRSGVTVALQDLEAKGLIRSERAVIQVLKRKGLVRVAGGAYGVPEAEYERLLG